MNQKRFMLFGVFGLVVVGKVTAAATPDAPVDSLDARYASVTTDTGDLAPGNTDFTRYTIPGLCVAAVSNAVDVFQHTITQQLHVRQLRSSTPAGDTIPASVRMLAQKCGARFTVAGPRTDDDLADLFTLALAAGNDELANAVLGRRLARATTDSMRAAILHGTVTMSLAAAPRRVSLALAAATRLDALSPTVQALKLKNHAALMWDATARFDVPVMRREAERIIALGQGPITTFRYEYLPIIGAYMVLGQIAYVEAPDSVMTVMARAKADLGRFPPGDEFPPDIPFSPIMSVHFRTATLEQIRDHLLPFNGQQYAGTTLPPVSASYWFPKAPEQWPPSAGHPSVVFYGGELQQMCARNDWGILGGAIGEHSFCDPLYTALPQWAILYGDRLAMTLVAQTRGFAARSVPLAPSAEADTLGWFFREHLKLPVTVGIVVDSVWRLPIPDGRHFWSDTTFYGSFSGGRLVVLLYDARGTPIYVGDLHVPVLQALIDREKRSAAQKNVR
jgi:hypothetical protein